MSQRNGRWAPYGTYGRQCLICGCRKPQKDWSTVATCGAEHGKAYQKAQSAARRRDRLKAKGIDGKPPLVAYALGYEAGYRRAKYRFYLSARVAS